jgi:U3 small nucleolar RNA-associated protein 14
VEVQLPSVAAPATGKKAARAAAAAAAEAAAAEAEAEVIGAVSNGLGAAAHAGLFGAQHRKGKKGQRQTAADADEGPSTSQPAGFIAAKVWQGPKAGYVFKRDTQGLGYYLDTQPAAGGKKGRKQQQVQGHSVQDLLQRQQQVAGSSSDDDELGGAAAGLRQAQQQKKKKQQKQPAAVNGHAAGGGGAMQLLSSEADLNRQLLQAAFAGDDVEADFESEKAAEVEAELPSAEVAGQLPGWGTWSDQQREPAWMVAAKAKAAAQRTSAAAARKDANLKHVVISEKWDKKAAKYLTPSLPFPFNDRQVYENAMRQPLGRQYNPDAAFRNLTRPAVLKSAGVVIEPARFSKSVEQYNAGGSGKGRAVVTIAGGMQLEGQAAGTGAGGVGKGVVKKKKKPQQQQGVKGAGKGKRLHEAA